MFKRTVHPGLVLKDELEGLGVTPTEFARQIDLPPNRISQILSGKRSVPGTALCASATGSAPTRSSG